MKHSFRILPAFFALAALPVLAAPPAPPSPPEVKKTVDAFVGDWQLEVTAQPPGGAPAEKETSRMLCEKAVQGRAVICNASVTVPAGRPWQATFLIGYDVEEKNVRFFGITGDPSVHDHVCRWKGDKEIVCDPLKALSFGKPITEDLAWSFGNNTIRLKTVFTNEDGSRVVIDGPGKRM